MSVTAPPHLQEAQGPREQRGPSALEEARELGAKPAGLGRRALAFSIDVVIGAVLLSPAIVGAVLMAVNGPAWSAWPFWLIVIGSALVWIYQLVNVIVHGLRGATAGKAALGVRSISSATLEKPGFWRIVLRSLVLSASFIIPILGPLAMFLSGPLDPAKASRSLLDRVGRCWAINVRSGLNPLDKPALLAARRQRDLSGIVTGEPLVPLGTWSGAGVYWNPAGRSDAGVVGFAGALAGWENGRPEAGA
jgi:uncharacterized RDD family membrane protein YckC